MIFSQLTEGIYCLRDQTHCYIGDDDKMIVQ